jgi:hypothetical protein
MVNLKQSVIITKFNNNYHRLYLLKSGSYTSLRSFIKRSVK